MGRLTNKQLSAIHAKARNFMPQLALRPPRSAEVTEKNSWELSIQSHPPLLPIEGRIKHEKEIQRPFEPPRKKLNRT